MAGAVNGSSIELGAEVKLQQIYSEVADANVQALVAGNHSALSQANFRLLADQQSDHWSFDFDYLMSVDNSSDLSALRSFDSTNESSAHYFDWEHTIRESTSTLIEHQFDRAAIKYSADNWIIQVGRQALSWGNGVVFHPMDLFNPFSPDAKDTSYKPGIDAFYSQYLFSSGDDIQLLWIPRKNPFTGKTDSDQQSTAIKYYGMVQSIQYDILIAEDYQQLILGLGVAAPIGDALWKFDLVSNERENKRNAISIDVNFQTSWMWGDHPASGFIEYYRNGFAVDEATDLSQLNEDIMTRLQRGQIFSIGQNFLVVGGQLQITALVTSGANLIYQLDDQSQLLLVNLVYNHSQNSNLIAGIQLANGRAGSEYGGYFTDSSRQFNAAPANQIYLRYEWYF